jgi:hypothetical protein
MSDPGDTVRVRGMAILNRLTASNPNADRTPSLALMQFALALKDDLQQVPYLDTTIAAEGTQPRVMFVGELVALTDAGVLIEVSYKGEDEIGPVRIRPLRGRIAAIEVAYDASGLESGRLPAQSVTVTLDSGDSVMLPLTRQPYGAAFLDAVLSALTG